mmetsp:Transcript_90352/g.258518  ORF Transcript_90352/g.258518 Transcript_90352/m.258518 type:complete len:290 (+) Transcript_90352:26-895(+)
MLACCTASRYQPCSVKVCWLVRRRKIDAFLDLAYQFRQHFLDQFLLMRIDGAVVMHCLDTLLAQGHGHREELATRHLVRVHEGALRDANLACQACHHAIRKLRACVRHGQCRRAVTGFGVDDLVAAEHDALRHRVLLRVREGRRGLRLREKRHDRVAGVATNYRHLGLQRIKASGLRHESPGAARIQRGHPKELARVENALLLQRLRCDWNRGVHWIGDHQDASIGACLRATCNQSFDDACIDGEEVIAGHAWLARHAGWDHDHIATLQSLLKVVAYEAHGLRPRGDVR